MLARGMNSPSICMVVLMGNSEPVIEGVMINDVLFTAQAISMEALQVILLIVVLTNCPKDNKV